MPIESEVAATAKYSLRAVPETYEDAEKITGFRLDRRANCSISPQGELEQERWCTLDCSRCSCGCEGGCGCGPSTDCCEFRYTVSGGTTLDSRTPRQNASPP